MTSTLSTPEIRQSSANPAILKPLLSRESDNSKLAKDVGKKVIYSLSLAQANLSGYEVCPYRTSGCTSVCVGSGGLAGVFPKIMKARIQKTKLFFENRPTFLEKLRNELNAANKYCGKRNIIGYVRLNTFSDIRWDTILDLSIYNNLRFYDYTKNMKLAKDSVVKNKGGGNYFVVYSYNEKSNWRECEELISMGGNIAVVFRDVKYVPSKKIYGEFPKTWKNIPVIDGDISDIRYNDPRGVIVGLRLKGTIARKKAACDAGFAQYAFPIPVSLTINNMEMKIR